MCSASGNTHRLRITDTSLRVLHPPLPYELMVSRPVDSVVLIMITGCQSRGDKELTRNEIFIEERRRVSRNVSLADEPSGTEIGSGGVFVVRRSGGFRVSVSQPLRI